MSKFKEENGRANMFKGNNKGPSLDQIPDHLLDQLITMLITTAPDKLPEKLVDAMRCKTVEQQLHEVAKQNDQTEEDKACSGVQHVCSMSMSAKNRKTGEIEQIEVHCSIDYEFYATREEMLEKHDPEGKSDDQVMESMKAQFEKIFGDGSYYDDNKYEH